MYLDTPPRLIPTTVFSTMPDNFRRRSERSDWADANRPGVPTDSFIEGPSFDAKGNLYVVDIPFGRIFRIAPDGAWSLVIEYEGWPNGLKIAKDGRILVADYMHGIMELDAEAGRIAPVLTARNSESFRGCNDLHLASNGDIYFTDQGQTGLQNPTGRLYRLRTNGQLDCILDNVPSPNGLVLNADENVVFLAVTRDNAIWRVPLMKDGTASKVGIFIQMSGGAGPDGMAIDSQGNLAICHAGFGAVWVFSAKGEPMYRIDSPEGPFTTNCAYGGADGKQLFITESKSGTVLVADL
ncbi:MAG: SMP-30/gluconolactonase/LRE family protein, partial [Bradyrhizobium guangdongense]